MANLYNADASGPYYGVWGIQWRGWVAYLCGILINVVGFAGAVGTPVPIGATYIYRLNFFSGFIVSAGVYWILCKIKPIMASNPTGHWYEVEDALQGQPDGTEGFDEEAESSSSEPSDAEKHSFYASGQKRLEQTVY